MGSELSPIVGVVIAMVLIFIAWKVVKGVVKFGLIALILAAVVWYLSAGGIG